MQPLKISAKNLGYTALADFCPRCYWVKLKTSHKLPWQTFPGIFSSIDSYTKHCVHHIIDAVNNTTITIPNIGIGSENAPPNKQIKVLRLPEWMELIGKIISYKTVPHWSKNTFYDPKSQITLHGAPDDLLILADGTLTIPDYKTQRWTDNQDKLFPLYAVQSNVYNILMTQDTKIDAKLFLVYMEPDTAKESACNNIIEGGFSMCFNAKVIPVETDKKLVRSALTITREIFEMDTPPDSRAGCKDCQALENVIELLK